MYVFVNISWSEKVHVKKGDEHYGQLKGSKRLIFI